MAFIKSKLKTGFFHSAVLLSVLALFILVGVFFVRSTQEDVNLQNKQYLSEIAIQNAEVIRNTVHMELDKIEAIANIIGTHEDFSTQHAFEILKAEDSRSSYKRMAYISTDGNALATDGTTFSVLDRAYYEKALLGVSNVSNRLIDKTDDSFINVYAVPLYFMGTFKGVIIATNDTGIFSNLLDTSTFGGEGFSYIITKDGLPVVYTTHKNSFLEFENIFDEMRANNVSEAEIDEMRRNMEQGTDGFISYSRERTGRIAAYSKIGINDWVIVSVVPEAVIFKYADRLIRRNILSVVLTAVILGTLIIFIVLQTQKNRKNLERLAYVDPVTGGNNLNKFKLLSAQMIEKHRRDVRFYMLRIDVDNFKLINDLYGYLEGDDVLLNMDKQIASMLSDEDIYGRIVSDNFMWLVKCPCDEDIMEKAVHFNQSFAQKMSESNKNYTVNFTIGIYKIPDGEMDIDKIIDRTTMAHRSAKLMPMDMKFSFYSESIREDAVRIKTIENIMRNALSNGEFCVYLQPKTNMSNGKMEGAEALVRWIRDGRVISPAEFVPVFEKNGFIVNIDLYMLEEVCRLQRKWQDAGLITVPISVNQSKPLVYSKDYMKKIGDIFAKYALPANLIELELLETIIHDNIGELIRITSLLRAQGILICIDDFGSGYSSLNMLKDLQADVLKIDRGFLSSAETNKRAEFVLSNIIDLAKGLNMEVVTEGVETQAQAELLMRLDCDIAQGYLYAKPMPVDQYEKKLMNR